MKLYHFVILLFIILLVGGIWIFLKPAENQKLKEAKQAKIDSQRPQEIIWLEQTENLFGSAWSINFKRPANWQIIKGEGGYNLKGEQGQEIIILWQRNFPRPSLGPEKQENFLGLGWQGIIYHDVDNKTGQEIDKLIFSMPDKKYEVYAAGKGAIFEELIKSLKIGK